MRYLLFFLLLSASLAALDNAIVPNAKLQLVTPQLGEGGLVSFLGELGARNLRSAITYANRWASCHRFKASAEFLSQDLQYLTGPRRWMSQYSLGAEYQCFFSSTVFRDVYVAGIFAHSYHRKSGLYRVAGADAGQAKVGTTLNPWKCAYLSAEFDYDYVRYHRLNSRRKIVSGLGGAVNLVQYLGREFSVRGDAEFHQPYWFYEGAFQWSRDYRSCKLHTGVYMNYTQGMEGLPNVLGGGVELSLSFGNRAEACCRPSPKGQGRCDAQWMCDLAGWALESAARIPVVLAIRDPGVVAAAGSCTPPTSTTIPDQSFIGQPTYSVNTSPYFSSTAPLTYSATNLPTGGSINSSTGVISGSSPRNNFLVTVTATSACGSTSQTFNIFFVPS